MAKLKVTHFRYILTIKFEYYMLPASSDMVIDLKTLKEVQEWVDIIDDKVRVVTLHDRATNTTQVLYTTLPKVLSRLESV